MGSAKSVQSIKPQSTGTDDSNNCIRNLSIRIKPPSSHNQTVMLSNHTVQASSRTYPSPETYKLASPRSQLHKVWLDAHNLKLTTPLKKLSSRRYGPFEVLQKISPVTYQIKLPQTWKIHNIFHMDLLTPYYETQAYGTMHSQPPPKLIDGKEEYEVEEIIDHRTFRQKKQYLVKWLGYSVSENSWVDKKDLHSPQLLQEYLSSRNPSDAQPLSACKSGTYSCL
jgi:Chromo (CHRromatin Organisation MOdifier) domain